MEAIISINQNLVFSLLQFLGNKFLDRGLSVGRSQQQQPSKSRYAWNDNLLKISPVRIIQAKQGAPPQTPACSQCYKTFLGN